VKVQLCRQAHKQFHDIIACRLREGFANVAIKLMHMISLDQLVSVCVAIVPVRYIHSCISFRARACRESSKWFRAQGEA
jgi:hypothetical protein